MNNKYNNAINIMILIIFEWYTAKASSKKVSKLVTHNYKQNYSHF